MVLLRQAGGEWHEPHTTAYDNEQALQTIVKLQPSLLPGGDDLAVVDELSIAGIGKVDLVGVAPDGHITIVECKLKANPEIRREVVGQVLAYAGGLWRMPYDEFAAAFQKRAGESLHEAVVGDVDADELRSAVEAHLGEGDFRLVIAVDEITPELKRIVEYLNAHTLSTTEVIALELGYAKDGDVELLIPEVYGLETAQQKSKSSTGWTPSGVAQVIADIAPGSVRAFIDRLVAHADEHAAVRKYGTGHTPTTTGYYDVGGKPTSVWSLFLKDEPYITLSFESITAADPVRAAGFLAALQSEPLIAAALPDVPTAQLLAKKWPKLSIAGLLELPGPQDALFSALDELTAAPGP